MKVLVVDDSNDNLTLFKVILERKGYDVATALNGAQALEILRKEPADLILSDILMPVMDGFRFLHSCKTDSRLQKIPFVFITGAFLDPKDEELAYKSGVVSFIRKPVEPDVLISVVEESLAHASLKKRTKKPKTEKAEIDRQVNISLMEKLQAKMHALEEEIADRRKAEAALKQAEAEFRLLFNTMAQGVVYEDASGNIISANKAAERILGLSYEQMLGRNTSDPRWQAIHEDGSDFPAYSHPTMTALRTGQPVNNVVMGIFNPRENKYRWINVNAVPQFRHGEDIPYQVYATFDDITDSFLAFKALQEHEARQHAILENTNDAIYAVDRDFRITAANEASQKIYSLIASTERTIKIGDNVFDLIPVENRSHWDNKFRKALNGEKIVFENRYDTSLGPLYLEISINPIVSPSQEITGFSVFGRDITQRKQTEAKMKESELRYRSLIEHTAEAIYVVQGGRIVFARSGPSPITGYTGDELIGKRWSDLIAPDDYDHLRAEYKESQSGNEEPQKKYVFKVTCKSGEMKWVESHVTDITWEGKPAIITFQTDITEHKQLEAELKKTSRLYKTLYECNEAMVLANTERQLFQNTCNVLVETGGYYAVLIASAENDEPKMILPLAYSGSMNQYIDSLKLSWSDDWLGQNPLGKAVRTGKTIVIHDVFNDPDFTPWVSQAREQGYAAIVALPLKSYWQTTAVLAIFSPSANAFEQDEISLLEQLSADLSHGITSLREKVQREHAEEALRESEQRFRKAVQSTTDIVWDWDIASGSLDWYGDIDEMLGYSYALLPRTREAWENILHPDDRQRVMAALKKLAQTGEPYNTEYRILRKDGSVRNWIDRGLPLRDRQGNIIRAVGACVDITQRRMEDANAKIRRDLAFNLAASTDLKEALQQSLDAAIEISGTESGAIFLLDNKTGDFNLVHCRGVSAPTIEMFSRLTAGSEDVALISRGSAIYTSASQVTARYEGPFKVEGWTFAAALPVVHKGRTTAFFLVCSHHLSDLGNAARNSLETIAADVGMVIERIQSLEALQASEEKYRLVVENAREGIIVLQEAYAKFVNQYVSDLIGYSRDYILSHPFLDFIYPDDRQLVMERYRLRLSGVTIFEPLIFRLNTAEGSFVWVEIRAVLIEWEGHKATLNFVTDITQRKKTEDALRKSEEKYRKMLEQMDEVYYEVDSRGNLTFFNETLAKKLGYPTDTLTGLNYKAIIPPEDIRKTVSIFSEVFRTGNSQHDVPVVNVCRDGTRIFFQISIYPVRDEKGETTGLRGLGRDITHHKMAEEALRLRAILLDSTYDSVIAYNLDGTIVYSNETAASTRGYTIDEMLQLNIQQILPDHELPLFKTRLQKILDDGSLAFEGVNKRKDGSEFYVEARARLIDVAGQKTIIVVYRDITERKKTESELNRALETVTSTLEGTMEAIAMMSELRDPYTAGHQKMVTLLALAIGREIGLAEEQLRGLRVAGLLHDVGKVYVPSEILSKPGKLSDLEKNLAKAHAVAGYDIVKAIKFPWAVDEIIHQHHERVDGSGYPRGLKGEQILIEARILAVADTVEAMMSHRPYRAALGLDKALEEIITKRGILYDEKVVDACVRLFKEKGFTFPQ